MAVIGKLVYSSVTWVSESCSWICSALVQKTYDRAIPIFNFFWDAGCFIGFWSERRVDPVKAPSLPDASRVGNSRGGGEGSSASRKEEGEDSGSSSLDPFRRNVVNEKEQEESALEEENEIDPTIAALQWDMTPEELEAQKKALSGFSRRKAEPVKKEKQEPPRLIIAEQDKEMVEASRKDVMNRYWSKSGTSLLEKLSQQIEQLEPKKEDLKKLEFCLAHRAFKQLDTPQNISSSKNEDPLIRQRFLNERQMLRDRIESTIEKISDKSLLDLSIKDLHDEEIERKFQTITASYQELSEPNQEREKLYTQLIQEYKVYHTKLQLLTHLWEIRGEFLKKKRQLEELF